MNAQDTTAQSAQVSLPRKRLTGSEREALVNMSVALDVLMKAQPDLKARAKMVNGGNRDIAMVIAKLTKLMERFYDTITAEQLRTYYNNLKMASITVGVKNPATLGKRKSDDYGMWLSYEAINQLFEGCHDKCLMCGLDTEGQRRCSLRKALDSIPNDLAQNEGECPYYEVI